MAEDYGYYLNLFDNSSGICTDTRNIKEGCLFIALKGANFNGNKFSREAIKLGAKFAIVDEIEFANHKNILWVEDTLVFLQKLANFHRNRFDIPVIGITGSNGKTSTKELINTVLKKKFSVLCTKGNLNNHIGVPLTILQLNQSHEIAIVEMGANHIGEIDELCQIAEPNHGIITNIGKAHLEGFKDFEGVFKTKTALYDFVIKSNGNLVYNSDDGILSEYLNDYIKKHSKNVVQTQLIGKYNFYNFLAAICFGKLFNLEDQQINEAISSYVSHNKRSEVQKTENNTLIVDCYNANPSSMKSALESFALMENEKSLAILGDMKELGKDSVKEHMNLLKLCDDLNIEYITIGEEFMTYSKNGYSDVLSFVKNLKKNTFKGYTILLKGSRGMALETLIQFL